MAAVGSIFKVCACIDDLGQKLGRRCPQLRGPDGVWSSRHGRWYYRLELARASCGKRQQVRRAALVNTHPAVIVELEHARRLVDLAGGDSVLSQEIATLLLDLPHDRALPEPQVLARRLHSGIPGGVNLNLADYLQWWVVHRRIDERTRISYESHIRVHLIPHLGGIRLITLTIADVEGMFARIRVRNEQILDARRSADATVRDTVGRRRVTSTATMHRIKATLRKALNDAVGKYRLIEHNPAVYVELPQRVRPMVCEWTDAAVAQWRASGFVPSPLMVWTPAQAGRFLDWTAAHDPDLYPLFLLTMLYGPRRGEVVGVRTDQVDLDKASVTFTHQIATHIYKPVYKKVKTKSGARVVALDQDTAAELRSYWRRRQAWQEAAAGSSWPTTVELHTSTADGDTTVGVDLFFRQSDGRAWHPERVGRRFERAVRLAGLPPVRFHDGRHGAATYTKAAGGDLLDLKHKLGHSSVAIAGDVYPIVLRDLERELAERTAALIPRQGRRSRREQPQSNTGPHSTVLPPENRCSRPPDPGPYEREAYGIGDKR